MGFWYDWIGRKRGKGIREGQLKPLEVREVFERLRRRRPLLRRHICWIKLDTPVAKAKSPHISLDSPYFVYWWYTEHKIQTTHTFHKPHMPIHVNITMGLPYIKVVKSFFILNFLYTFYIQPLMWFNVDRGQRCFSGSFIEFQVFNNCMLFRIFLSICCLLPI